MDQRQPAVLANPAENADPLNWLLQTADLAAIVTGLTFVAMSGSLLLPGYMLVAAGATLNLLAALLARHHPTQRSTAFASTGIGLLGGLAFIEAFGLGLSLYGIVLPAVFGALSLMIGLGLWFYRPNRPDKVQAQTSKHPGNPGAEPHSTRSQPEATITLDPTPLPPPTPHSDVQYISPGAIGRDARFDALRVATSTPAAAPMNAQKDQRSRRQGNRHRARKSLSGASSSPPQDASAGEVIVPAETTHLVDHRGRADSVTSSAVVTVVPDPPLRGSSSFSDDSRGAQTEGDAGKEKQATSSDSASGMAAKEEKKAGDIAQSLVGEEKEKPSQARKKERYFDDFRARWKPTLTKTDLDAIKEAIKDSEQKGGKSPDFSMHDFDLLGVMEAKENAAAHEGSVVKFQNILLMQTFGKMESALEKSKGAGRTLYVGEMKKSLQSEETLALKAGALRKFDTSSLATTSVAMSGPLALVMEAVDYGLTEPMQDLLCLHHHAPLFLNQDLVDALFEMVARSPDTKTEAPKISNLMRALRAAPLVETYFGFGAKCAHPDATDPNQQLLTSVQQSLLYDVDFVRALSQHCSLPQLKLLTKDIFEFSLPPGWGNSKRKSVLAVWESATPENRLSLYKFWVADSDISRGEVLKEVEPDFLKDPLFMELLVKDDIFYQELLTHYRASHGALALTKCLNIVLKEEDRSEAYIRAMQRLLLPEEIGQQDKNDVVVLFNEAPYAAQRAMLQDQSFNVIDLNPEFQLLLKKKSAPSSSWGVSSFWGGSSPASASSPPTAMTSQAEVQNGASAGGASWLSFLWKKPQTTSPPAAPAGPPASAASSLPSAASSASSSETS